MRASGVGARRFYHAFYRWTVLVETSHPCTRVLSTSTRNLSQQYRSGRRDRSRYSGSRSADINHGNLGAKPLANERNGDSVQLPNIYGQEVRTVNEQPFSAMDPWEEVVRYKSLAGYSIEICIPQGVVTQIERESGSLYPLVGVQDLQIDLGHPTVKQNTSGQSTSVRSVLVTGSGKDIENLRIQLQQIRKVSNPSTSKGGNTKPEHVEQHIRPPKHSLRNHAKNSEDIEKQQLRNKSQDSQPNHPLKSSQSTKGPTKKGLVGSDRYFLEVRYPLKLSSDKEETSFHWPVSMGEQLREAAQRTQCILKLHAPFLRFEGPSSGILEARRRLQAFLDEACDNQAVARRELQDVIALAKYADAIPLVNRRKREAKFDRFKEALRPLTHPVALVTASLPVKDGEKTIDHYRGVTVSSFTSVSMSKADPLVSFNLRLPSRTWDAMKSNKAIGINLLDASPEGAAISHAFTQPHDDPSEAFREIRRLGYELVPFYNWAPCVEKPPFTRGGSSGVFCTLAAQVVEDKCVDVGDHVIVIAAVKFVRWVKSAKEKAADGELFGLSYNNKEYRTAGHAIKPASIPHQDELGGETASREIDVSEDIGSEQAAGEPQTNNSPGSYEINETPMNHIVDPDVHSTDVQDGEPFIEDQTVTPVAETATAGAEGSFEDSSSQILTVVDEEQTTESLEQMDTDLANGLDSLETFDQASSESTSSEHTPTSAQNSEPHPSGTQPTPNSLLGFLKQPFRRYHTSARALSAQAQVSTTNEEDQREANTSDQPVPSTTIDDFLSSHYEELYRSTSTRAETSEINQAGTSKTNEGDALQSGVADQLLLSMTINDFLDSHDGEPYVPRRMRALIKAKKQAYAASKRLERNLETDTLTSEEIQQLERTVTLNKCWIAKRLAFNSAYDLRLMLDKGKVDVRRAQWLESSIEKGQAVLLAELQQIREMVQEGKMTEERYEIAKTNLETDHQTLATEAMRLRHMTEEEGYDGGASAPEKKGFDGFSGNV